MPRTISTGLATEFAKVVTQPGYLVQINASQIRRWSTFGDIVYQGVPWISMDFEVLGLQWDPDKDLQCTLTVQNLDSAIAAWILLESLADVTVDIYQFAAGALADGDAPQLARMVFDSCQVKLDQMNANLVQQSSLFAFSPRRRVDVPNGFSYALPKGSQIAWGNEIYVVEPDTNV